MDAIENHPHPYFEPMYDLFHGIIIQYNVRSTLLYMAQLCSLLKITGRKMLSCFYDQTIFCGHASFAGNRMQYREMFEFSYISLFSDSKTAAHESGNRLGRQKLSSYQPHSQTVKIEPH